MILAFCLGLGLQMMVTEVPYFVRLFGTVKLSRADWKLLLILSAVPLIMHELLLLPQKFFSRTEEH